jgi:phosphocarrier protein HPr
VITREVQVVNRLGLHARASARLVQLLAPFRSQVFLGHRGRKINAKSIMGLMMLAAARGSTLTLEVEGPDEAEAADAVAALFAARFGEDE